MIIFLSFNTSFYNYTASEWTYEKSWPSCIASAKATCR